MIDLKQYLEAGESLGATSDISLTAGHTPDYRQTLVEKPGRRSIDRLFLTINRQTEPLVLVDGPPLKIRAFHGLGRLSLVDLAHGLPSSVCLYPGVDVEIAAGTLYQYANGSTYDPLVIRDTCIGFQEENEPTLRQFAGAALIGLGIEVG